MSKHTPGPWQAEYDEGFGHIIRMGNAIEHRGAYNVEEIIHYEHGLFEDESTEKGREQFKRAEANARLIAASPELLEALRACVITLGQIEACGEMLTEERPVLDAARAAIKKATGETK